ncbi:predicted protein [Plenodomus lingam JN3]|uniref:Predicted protein n=2 Tax=Leptosphaeria maculans TaxID=5022 RepID=E4ZPV4_LEPMJ|nr:predicted protein [Plenodomus lingam JN3]CBX93489.1 predicted protein [Plenodomus lingam JN3]
MHEAAILYRKHVVATGKINGVKTLPIPIPTTHGFDTADAVSKDQLVRRPPSAWSELQISHGA